MVGAVPWWGQGRGQQCGWGCCGAARGEGGGAWHDVVWQRVCLVRCEHPVSHVPHNWLAGAGCVASRASCTVLWGAAGPRAGAGIAVQCMLRCGRDCAAECPVPRASAVCNAAGTPGCSSRCLPGVLSWVLGPHLSGAGGEAPTAAAATKDPAQAAPPRAPAALRFAVRGRRRSWRSARAMWMLGHPRPCPNLALHCAMLQAPPFAV